MSENVGTLRSRLIRRLLTLQAGLLGVFALVLLVTLLSGFALEKRDEDRVIGILQQALARDANGELVLLPGPDLAQLRSESPDLWFLIRDQGDHSLSEGDSRRLSDE